MKATPRTLATQIRMERLSDDRRNRRIADIERVKAATRKDMMFVHDGRGVRVFAVGPDYVGYFTWAEGKGERRMRCMATWDSWYRRFRNHFIKPRSRKP